MAWEQERSGDPPAPWLGEVRDAIKESVQEPRKDEFTLESTSTRKVIKKKKNWSDPGPEKLLIFGGKRQIPYMRACPRVCKQSQTNPKTFLGALRAAKYH